MRHERRGNRVFCNEEDRLDQPAPTSYLGQVDQGDAMSTAIINLYEAKSRLSQLVERAAAGEEIIIAKAGKPKARLVPLSAHAEPREPGGWEGRIWVAEDFDDPLPANIQAAFEGKD
jgi:prevent-host-death family protein